METDAYPLWDTGDFGVQRSGKFTYERDKRKGTHVSMPMSIIAFNPSEDIEGERERETLLMKKTSAASYLKRGSRVSSARVECANMLYP